MDQAEINILDAELLQSRIKTPSNALAEGTRELAHDLPNQNQNPTSS